MTARRTLWYSFIRGTVKYLFFKLRTGGLSSITEENVPREGGIILAANHISHFDPPAIGCGTKRQLTYMAKEDLFKGIFGVIIRSMGAFPVKRGEGDTESIRRSIQLLESGHAIVLFPEGTRGDGSHLGPLSPGVAMLAKRTGVPVVPVGVVGTHIVLPKGQKKIKRHRITLVFGEPLTYASTATEQPEKDNRVAFMDELAIRISTLCRDNGYDLAPSEATK